MLCWWPTPQSNKWLKLAWSGSLPNTSFSWAARPRSPRLVKSTSPQSKSFSSVSKLGYKLSSSIKHSLVHWPYNSKLFPSPLILLSLFKQISVLPEITFLKLAQKLLMMSYLSWKQIQIPSLVWHTKDTPEFIQILLSAWFLTTTLPRATLPFTKSWRGSMHSFTPSCLCIPIPSAQNTFSLSCFKDCHLTF